MFANRGNSPPISAAAIASAIAAVDRSLFIPEKLRHLGGEDRPLSIGCGQTISAPHAVQLLLEEARLTADARVLDVGTGSGFQAAVLARLVAEVHSVERIEFLHRRARQALGEARADRVHLHLADGYQGWPQAMPYDAIIVACAPTVVPRALVEQLAEGGRLVLPVGEGADDQQIEIIERLTGGKERRLQGPAVRFVPMVEGLDAADDSFGKGRGRLS